MTKKLSERRAEQARKNGANVLRDMNEIKRLHAEGKSCIEIAKILGKPESSVRILLKADLG